MMRTPRWEIERNERSLMMRLPERLFKKIEAAAIEHRVSLAESARRLLEAAEWPAPQAKRQNDE